MTGDEFRNRVPYELVPTNISGAYGVVERGITVPELEVVPSRRTNLLRYRESLRDRPVRPWSWNAGGFLNNLWAGAWHGGSWTRIEGTWAIPGVSAPPEPAGIDGLYWMYSWIGLDGAGTNELLQIGIDQRVHPDGSTECNPWFEWVAVPTPTSPAYVSYTRIKNFPVRPGERVSCVVMYLSLDDTPLGGRVEMTNLSTGQSTFLVLAPPPNTTMAGVTAEWIVECPGTGYPDFSLAQFTTVKFEQARVVGPSTTRFPVGGHVHNIRNAKGVVVTAVELPDESNVPKDWLRIRHYNDGLCQRLKNLCQTTRATLFPARD